MKDHAQAKSLIFLVTYLFLITSIFILGAILFNVSDNNGRYRSNDGISVRLV